ncbi:prepilin peptidase [Actinokineospora spheciospongiae]|uniref:prepilin peptidase n=1 Tax=Actinokineospora spheciospongiae TaxID=909613 RepID=UPI000D7154AB|nr:A24 family peptidase [Actinokineospora spheciospongiae]PWW54169.1 leader peptidase (prepilin peptidase)/N-methyltransferase [Actinokineospora spheciospongiae]
MTKTSFPMSFPATFSAAARVSAQVLAVACLVLLCAAWLSPFLVLALATGSLAGALSRNLLAKVPHGTRAGPGQCELPTALLWTVVAFLWQHAHLPTAWLTVVLPLTWVAVPLAVVDLHHRRLPRALTVPTAALALPLLAGPALTTGWVLLLHAVLGAAVLGALHSLIHHANPAALGRGDVFLSAPLGAVQGALGLPALIAATFLAAVTTLALHVVTRRTPRYRTGVPHAPGMLLGTTTVALVTLAGV